jgi:asparagine synthase (glutamine-hydrolysing)
LLDDLKNKTFEVVAEAINEDTHLAVAFSGGIDSSVLAKICKDIERKNVVLLTVGFPYSEDIEFSKRMSSKIGLPHKIFEIEAEDFSIDLARVVQKIGCKNISHIENCVAYFYIAKLAKENDIRLILTANGCDELFCGYDQFRRIYDQGKTHLMELMDEKIGNELILTKEIEKITKDFMVTTRQPFLSQKFISFARDIPIDQKIKGSNDLIRKHILREFALLIGVPRESVIKPKKALQYGSLIHKNFKKISNF